MAKNAGLLAVQIIAASDENMLKKMLDYKKKMEEAAMKKNETLKDKI